MKKSPTMVTWSKSLMLLIFAVVGLCQGCKSLANRSAVKDVVTSHPENPVSSGNSPNAESIVDLWY